MYPDIHKSSIDDYLAASKLLFKDSKTEAQQTKTAKFGF